MSWFEKPEWVIVVVTVVYVIITGVYAVIAGLTLSAIKRQAKLMQQQVDDAKASSSGTTKLMERQISVAEKSVMAAQDNAKAALLNAHAVISAERPWLLVNIEAHKYEPNTFIIQAFNAGRTPAELHEGQSASGRLPLNFIPTADFRDPFRLPIQTLIVSKDSFTIRLITPGELIEQYDGEVAGLDPQMQFYGRILYWDVFTDRTAPGAKPYETRWSFRYEPLKRCFEKSPGGYAGNT